MKPTSGKYLPHIDGLRAIAILGVLLTHFSIPGAPGGFLGVDVFFVISGFLITRLIMAEVHQTGTFNFRRFYLRRVRRLVPATLTTLALTLAIFATVFSRRDFIELLDSVPFAVLPLANHHFYAEVGYFDLSAQLKPLLHFWSLAVEEQFYFFWPALLLALLKFPRTVLPVAALLFIGSLGAAQFTVASNPAGAFYLLPFRAFELLAGALLAAGLALYGTNGKTLNQTSWHGEAAAMLGLFLIFAAYVFLHEDMPLPGLLSLVACLGACLVIVFGNRGIVGRLLSLKPMLWIGLISYSLYLVHWPLAVYAAYRLPMDPPLLVKFGLVAMAIILGAVSYYAVERTFRQPSQAKGRWREVPVLGSLTALALLLGVGSVFLEENYANSGPSRAAAQGFQWGKLDYSRTKLPNSPTGAAIAHIAPGTGQPTMRLLVLGDSHGGQLEYGAAAFFSRNDIAVDLFTMPGCPALFGVTRYFDGKSAPARDRNCRANAQIKQSLATSNAYRGVILSSRWSTLIEPSTNKIEIEFDGLVTVEDRGQPSVADSKALFEQALDTTVRELLASGKKVILISQVPPLGNDLVSCQALLIEPATKENGRCTRLSRTQIAQRTQFVESAFAGYADHSDVLAIASTDIFCDAAACLLHDPETGELLYEDSNHLSHAGSTFLFDEIERRYDLLAFLQR